MRIPAICSVICSAAMALVAGAQVYNPPVIPASGVSSDQVVSITSPLYVRAGTAVTNAEGGLLTTSNNVIGLTTGAVVMASGVPAVRSLLDTRTATLNQQLANIALSIPSMLVLQDTNHVLPGYYSDDFASTNGIAGGSNYIWSANQVVNYYSYTTNTGGGVATKAHYIFNADATDSSGNSYNAIPTDTIITNGILGNAFHFNGSTSQVEVPTNAMVFGNGSRTFACWVRFDGGSETYSTILAVGPDSYGQQFSLLREDSNDPHIYFTSSGAGEAYISALATTGVWYHVALTYSSESSTMTLYLDGVGIWTNTMTLNTSDSTGVMLGYMPRATSYHLAGAIDDARFYTVALTSNEVANLYNNGVGTESDYAAARSPIAHWKMNDNAADTVVLDSAGTNNGVAQQDTENITTTGKINSALTFNGSTDKVEIPGSLGLTGATNWSFSAWVKLASIPSLGGLFEFSHSGQQLAFLIGSAWGGPAKFYAAIGGDPNDFKELIDPGTDWHMYSVTCDGITLRLYFDGASLISKEIPLVIGDDTAFTVGYSPLFSLGIPGDLDDVRVYNTALTSNDIAAIYNGGVGTEGNVCSGISNVLVVTSATITTAELTIPTNACDYAHVSCLAEWVSTNTPDWSQFTAGVSRDGGSTWTDIPLSYSGVYSPTGTIISGWASTTNGTGSPMLRMQLKDGGQLKFHSWQWRFGL